MFLSGCRNHKAKKPLAWGSILLSPRGKRTEIKELISEGTNHWWLWLLRLVAVEAVA
jgi:hypothetical protein